MTELDLSILDWIQANLQCSFLDTTMPVVTALGNAGMIWIIMAVILLIIPKTRRYGLAVAMALLLDLLLCNILIKPLVARVRPYTLRDVELLIAAPTDYSFPSGHTAAAFAATSSLFFSKNKGWIPALILSIIIAFTRLYLYVHYPSDVVGGALLGVFCGWLGAFICSGFLRLKRSNKSDSVDTDI